MIEKIVMGEAYAAIGFSEEKTPVRVVAVRVDVRDGRAVLVARVGGAGDEFDLDTERLMRERKTINGREEPVTWAEHEKRTAHQLVYEMRRQFGAHMSTTARNEQRTEKREGWVKLSLGDYEDMQRGQVEKTAVGAACEWLITAVAGLAKGDIEAARAALAKVGVTL